MKSIPYTPTSPEDDSRTRVRPILAPHKVRWWDEAHLIGPPWSEEEESDKWRRHKLPPDILNTFCNLAASKHTEGQQKGLILRFANKHGLLGLCEHGLPCGHIAAHVENAWVRKRGGKREKISRLVEGCNWTVLEPWRTWDRLAREASAIRRLRLRGGNADLWNDALWLTRQRGVRIQQPGPNASEQEVYGVLKECVNTWLICGYVRPQLALASNPYPGFPYQLDLLAEPAYPNLFGALAVALAQEVFARGNSRYCVECGKPFTVSGKHTCCPECRAARFPSGAVKATAHKAYETYKANKREAKQLYREGHSTKDIVRRLGLKPRRHPRTHRMIQPEKRVRRWLGLKE